MLERGQATDPLRPYTSDSGKAIARVNPEFVARQSGPVPIDVGGTGCLLIRRHVFERLERPWFCACDEGLGEDSNFTLRSTDAGFRLVLDPTTQVGHITAHANTLSDVIRIGRSHA